MWALLWNYFIVMHLQSGDLTQDHQSQRMWWASTNHFEGLKDEVKKKVCLQAAASTACLSFHPAGMPTRFHIHQPTAIGGKFQNSIPPLSAVHMHTYEVFKETVLWRLCVWLSKCLAPQCIDLFMNWSMLIHISILLLWFCFSKDPCVI